MLVMLVTLNEYNIIWDKTFIKKNNTFTEMYYKILHRL